MHFSLRHKTFYSTTFILLSAVAFFFSAHGAAAVSCSGSGTVTCTFGYNGGSENWTIPAGATSLTVNVYGAGGGGGDYYGGTDGYNGDSSSVSYGGLTKATATGGWGEFGSSGSNGWNGGGSNTIGGTNGVSGGGGGVDCAYPYPPLVGGTGGSVVGGTLAVTAGQTLTVVVGAGGGGACDSGYDGQVTVTYSTYFGPGTLASLAQTDNSGNPLPTSNGYSWLNAGTGSTIKLSAADTDSSSPANIKFYFELRPNNASFTMTTTEPTNFCDPATKPYSGAGACAYNVWKVTSGSGPTYSATAAITAVSEESANGYHWQVLACDATTCSTLAQLGSPTNPNFKVDTTAPTVTDGNISVSGCTGTGGACKIGDTVTVTWNNTSGGDNNSDIASATANMTQFGGGASVVMSSSSGTWTGSYTILGSEGIDLTNRNASVTATDNVGNATTTADTSNETVDTIRPVISAGGNMAISTDNNSNGVANINDKVTYNHGTISSGDGDTWAFSPALTASPYNATLDSGTTYTIHGGTASGSYAFTETAMDNAGNVSTPATSIGSLSFNNAIPLVSITLPNGDSQTINSDASGNFDLSYTLTYISSVTLSSGSAVFHPASGSDVTCSLSADELTASATGVAHNRVNLGTACASNLTKGTAYSIKISAIDSGSTTGSSDDTPATTRSNITYGGITSAWTQDKWNGTAQTAPQYAFGAWDQTGFTNWLTQTGNNLNLTGGGIFDTLSLKTLITPITQTLNAQFNGTATNTTVANDQIGLSATSEPATLTQTDDSANTASQLILGGWNNRSTTAFSNTQQNGTGGSGASVQLSLAVKTGIFVTSSSHNGDFTNFSGAASAGARDGLNKFCQNDANKPAAAFSVKGFVSVDGTDNIAALASTYVSTNPIYWYNPGSPNQLTTLLDNTWAHMLTAGTNILNSQQSGTGSGSYVYSGSNRNGTSNGVNCNGWTSSSHSDSAYYGGYSNVNDAWLNAASGNRCDVAGIYRCIFQLTQSTYNASGTYTSFVDAGVAASYAWGNFTANTTLNSGGASFVVQGSSSSSSVPACISAGNCNAACTITAAQAASGQAISSNCFNPAADRYLWYQATLTAGSGNTTTPTLDQVSAAVQRGFYYSVSPTTLQTTDATGPDEAGFGKANSNFYSATYVNGTGNGASVNINPIYSWADGAYNCTTATCSALPGGSLQNGIMVYNYTSFNINSGDTLTLSGNYPVQINVRDAVTINGYLLADGQNGSGATPGTGYVGGYSGGDSGHTNGYGPGGAGAGAGYGAIGGDAGNGSGGHGSIYGDTAITTLYGGSGGGFGASAGGGAGGGAINIRSLNSITIAASTGKISAAGGRGANSSTYQGASGGSGGSVKLEAPVITNYGTINVNGGNAGSKGSGCGTYYGPGGGAGGRIYFTGIVTGTVSATGGSGGSGSSVCGGAYAGTAGGTTTPTSNSGSFSNFVTYASPAKYASYVSKNEGTTTWQNFVFTKNDLVSSAASSISFKLISNSGSTPADGDYDSSFCFIPAVYGNGTQSIDISGCNLKGQYLWYRATLNAGSVNSANDSTPTLDDVKGEWNVGTATYTSGTAGNVLDGGTGAAWSTFSWSQSASGGRNVTGITMEARTSVNADMSGAASWGSCAIANGADLSTDACAHNGQRYIQYQATFTNASPYLETPYLNDVTINYYKYDTNNDTLVSSPFNSMNPYNAISRIFWNNLGAGSLKFQIRSAPDLNGAPNWAAGSGWCGSSGCDAAANNTPSASNNSYTTSGGVANSANTSNAQWFQYAAFLSSTDGSDTPVLDNVTTEYGFNNPPVVQATSAAWNGTSLSVNYNLNDAEQTSANVQLYYKLDGAPGYTLASGGTLTGTGTVNGISPSPAVESISWTPPGGTLTGQETLKIVADDGQSSNNIGSDIISLKSAAATSFKNNVNLRNGVRVKN